MDDTRLMQHRLDDSVLEKVSGGIAEAGTSAQKKCPVCSGKVFYSRNNRLEGGNLTLYKCNACSREYSFSQIKGEENLSVNYTGLGDDKFGR